MHHGKEKVEVMIRIKNKTLSALAGELKIIEFEAWLYEDEWVNNRLAQDQMVYELVTINFKAEDVRDTLSAFCSKYFREEECLVAKVEYNSRRILECTDTDLVKKYIAEIADRENWFDYELVVKFYLLNESFLFSEDGFNSLELVLKQTMQIAQCTLENFESCTVNRKVEMLVKGINCNRNSDQPKQTKEVTKSQGK